MVAGQQGKYQRKFLQYSGVELNKLRGLNHSNVFRPYRQFAGNDCATKRKVVVCSPQKIKNGAVSLDLLFEIVENQSALLVLCGYLAPGSIEWKLHYGLVS